uniref:Membrane-spanning 4-domains subfamily A member 6A n=1 Tax=Spermophilus dauricus TaxID=99837 RepID=A0A8C9PPP3_SPEDA
MISQPVPSANVAVLTSNGINFPQTENTRPTHSNLDNLKKRLKAEVKVIGTIQIMCGVMVLSLGIILASAPFSQHFTWVYSALLKSGYPFIGGLLFIVCGSLSIVTEKMSTEVLVNSSLITNILSALCALVGFFIIVANLAALGPAAEECVLKQQAKPTPFFGYYYPHNGENYRGCYPAKASLAGVLSVMLIGTVLEAGLAVLISVLWWLQAHSDVPGVSVLAASCHRNKPAVRSKQLKDTGGLGVV